MHTAHPRWPPAPDDDQSHDDDDGIDSPLCLRERGEHGAIKKCTCAVAIAPLLGGRCFFAFGRGGENEISREWLAF